MLLAAAGLVCGATSSEAATTCVDLKALRIAVSEITLPTGGASIRGQIPRMDRSSCSVSEWVLHEMDGWSNRRSERRLEGEGTLDDDQHPHTIPHGWWARDHQ
jgi:hypothetical protein